MQWPRDRLRRRLARGGERLVGGTWSGGLAVLRERKKGRKGKEREEGKRREGNSPLSAFFSCWKTGC